MESALKSFNPATGELLREYPGMEIPECLDILEKNAEAGRSWRQLPLEKRIEPVLALARLLEQGRAHHAALITRETGKPIRESRKEVEDAVRLCRYFASEAPGVLADEEVNTGLRRSIIRHRPLGAILGIMPWNFPLLQPLRPAIPAMLAGNSFLLKPARSTPDCGLTLEALCREAGFPENLFRTLLTSAEAASVAFVHPAVQGISFTGSTRVGKAVAAQAGSQIKRVVLELGGSDPAIVLEDANLEKAADGILAGKLIFGGQHCISVKRILAARPVYDELRDRLVRLFTDIRPGDPTDENTLLGPLGTAEQLEEVEQQVKSSLATGARALTGGSRLEGPGYYYPLTLIENATPDMPVLAEEVFGPVVTLSPFDTEEEAAALANQSPYGLGASIYTRDLQRAQSLADLLEAGMVYFNGPVRSVPELPFGGIKESGMGRELGPDGLRAFTYRQVVATP